MCVNCPWLRVETTSSCSSWLFKTVIAQICGVIHEKSQRSVTSAHGRAWDIRPPNRLSRRSARTVSLFLKFQHSPLPRFLASWHLARIQRETGLLWVGFGFHNVWSIFVPILTKNIPHPIFIFYDIMFVLVNLDSRWQGIWCVSFGLRGKPRAWKSSSWAETAASHGHRVTRIVLILAIRVQHQMHLSLEIEPWISVLSWHNEVLVLKLLNNNNSSRSLRQVTQKLIFDHHLTSLF